MRGNPECWRSGCIFALAFSASSEFRHFVFVIPCSVLVPKQPNSRHVNLLSYVMANVRCFRSLLLTLNAVMFDFIHYRTVLRYTLLQQHVYVYWQGCSIFEYS